MIELRYMVFSWNDRGENFLYMSVYKHRAIEWAEDYYNSIKSHTWIECREVDLEDFNPCDYYCYIPNKKSIVWEKKQKNKAV